MRKKALSLILFKIPVEGLKRFLYAFKVFNRTHSALKMQEYKNAIQDYKQKTSVSGFLV